MTDEQRERFDDLVDRVVNDLPRGVRQLLDELPVIVLDIPTDDMLKSLDATHEEAADICGLHSGRAFTEASHEDSAELPSEIHLFRLGIVEMAGGWDAPDSEARIEEEIEITLLHEIGHQFGLDEDDLARLGYE